ncbi:hypothetical protein H0H92_000134 [Tricholoma furcatifolium]|nr:hypothetical protein H0H92_000134 [Tricholoma furcatifolium]
MSISIDIVPNTDSLDMFGEADASSAYSLSGHVSIAVTSPFALYGRRRTARILLRSVNLSFEGQSEVLTPQTGYSAVRLCTVTREISPREPLEMSNEGHEDSDKPCVNSGFWNVVFDLPIPGWLPESAQYGIEYAGIQYTLYAEVKFSVISENDTSPFSLSSLCSPFRSRVKTIATQKRIQVRRLVAPYENANAESGTVLQPRVSYMINAKVQGDSKFPAEVLNSLQVLATIPEHVNIDTHALPLTVRLRTRGLDTDKCKRIQVKSVSANLVQKERYRHRVSQEAYRRYPLPPRQQQPPHVPLRDPHPMGSIYESGLGAYVGWDEKVSRQFSVLPANETGLFLLGENNYPFASDADMPADEQTWYTLESSVPFVHHVPDDNSVDCLGSLILRPTAMSPLIIILHDVDVELDCSYDVPDSDEVVHERLCFSLPLQFQHFAPDPRVARGVTSPATHLAQISSQSVSPIPSLTSSKPYTASLPAYSQLFDHNGDRKIDYTVPLPLYTPQASPNSSSSSLDLDPESEPESIEMHEIDPLLSTRYDYDSE